MNFNKIPLEVPSLEEFKDKSDKLLVKLNKAKTVESAYKVLLDMNKLCSDFSTKCQFINIKFTLNTKDKVVSKAMNVINDLMPKVDNEITKFNKALVNSPFRSELEKLTGKQYFKLLDMQLEVFDEAIVPELVEENKLTMKYEEVISSAKIKFKGKTYNLPQLGKFLSDKDKDVRFEAAKAYWGFYAEHNDEIGGIYDSLVKVRDRMAKKMGYKNYVEFGYKRMNRSDYNAEMVKNYREQILKYVVPVSQKLRARQKDRLHIEHPIFTDYNLDFLSGNAKPIGGKDVLVPLAQEMYNEISSQTGEFFKMMVKNNLLDLEARAGKTGGGYMDFLPKYKVPFIFANFNGTSGDVDVLTHEVGHAFQWYTSKDITFYQLQMPTMEACEIHSMSMEFFAEPYMEKFFDKDADKYRFAHLADAINFLPYGACVDEFQHFVYENPEATHEERCKFWRQIEKKYEPHLDYAGIENLENGCLWMKQSHIFASPFYYIDYTLAQVVAFQFYILLNKNYKKAWKKYYYLCSLGGKYSFLELLKQAKLENPFKKGCLKKIMPKLEKALLKFDDQNM